MISAEVIKGVHELFENSNVHPRPNEPFADFVARGIGISVAQAEVLVETLHDGGTVQDAVQAAGIQETSVNNDLLVQIARVIGSTLGRVGAE